MSDKLVKLVHLQNSVTKDVPFISSLLIEKINKQAMFDAVNAELSGDRQGTHSTLTKAEVRGGGKKPWMQKHTGNARQGSRRNPQWVGGGVVFGPKPNRNYKIKLNSKTTHLAFKSSITEKMNKGSIYLFTFDKVIKPSTKLFVLMLKKLNLYGKKVLFICDKNQEVLIKSARNINKVVIKFFDQISTKDIINANFIFIQQLILKKLEEIYK